MATPAELLGQLAQQFEAAGNPQLAASFRGMAGGGAPTAGQIGGSLGRGTQVQPFSTPEFGSPAANPAGRVPPPALGMGQQLGGVGRGGWASGRRPLDNVGPLIRDTFRVPDARPTPRFAPTAGFEYGSPPFSAERTVGRDPMGVTGGQGAGFRQGPQGPRMGPGAQPAMQGPRKPPGSGPGAAAAAASEFSNPPQPGSAAAAASRRLGFRHPVADYRTIAEGYGKGLKGGTGGAARVGGKLQKLVPGAKGTAMSTSRYATAVAGSPFAAKSLAFLKVANPLFVTSFVGDMIGVNEWFEEGGDKDHLAEGMLFGASVGAPFGLPGALIGGAIASTLNVLTGGALIDIAQNIPLVGGMFGSEEVYDISGDAKKMFERAAGAQGDPTVAAAAAEIFDGYNNMIKNGVLPAGSEMQYMLQAGRMAGLTGFPWEPEALTPVYSAEDLAQITSSINDDLRPMYDVAQGLLQQDFSHITDPEAREKLLRGSEEQSTRIMEGIASALRGPTSAAMLGEANRPQSTMADQLAGGNAEFASLLAG